MRIKTSDFSWLAGYENGSNEFLYEYINLFKFNPSFDLFHIEEDNSQRLYFDTVCYIKDKIGHKDELGREIKMFTRTEKDDNGKPTKYFLCFSKIEKEKE